MTGTVGFRAQVRTTTKDPAITACAQSNINRTEN